MKKTTKKIDANDLIALVNRLKREQKRANPKAKQSTSSGDGGSLLRFIVGLGLLWISYRGYQATKGDHPTTPPIPTAPSLPSSETSPKSLPSSSGKSKYYTGPVNTQGVRMAELTPPFRWTPDGEYCVDSQGHACPSLLCSDPRPPLNCPPGYVVKHEPAGSGRWCVPAAGGEATTTKTRLERTVQEWGLPKSSIKPPLDTIKVIQTVGKWNEYFRPKTGEKLHKKALQGPTTQVKVTPPPLPYAWSADGQKCFDATGRSINPAYCFGQHLPRPPLKCPAGYIVRHEPAGWGRWCVPDTSQKTPLPAPPPPPPSGPWDKPTVVSPQPAPPPGPVPPGPWDKPTVVSPQPAPPPGPVPPGPWNKSTVVSSRPAPTSEELVRAWHRQFG